MDEFCRNLDCLSRINPRSSTTAAAGEFAGDHSEVKCTRWKPKKHRYGYIYILIHTWFLTNNLEKTKNTDAACKYSQSQHSSHRIMHLSIVCIDLSPCMPLQFRTNNSEAWGARTAQRRALHRSSQTTHRSLRETLAAHPRAALTPAASLALLIHPSSL